MHLSRRGFFGPAAAAAVGLTLDPERLLWRPGAKTIFLPPEKKSVHPSDTHAVLKPGDIFTIEGVYGIHPQTQRPTRTLRQFVVADLTDNGSVLSVVHTSAIPFTMMSDVRITGKRIRG